MAKVVPDDQNRFRTTWDYARSQGVSREVMADSLGISRGRLNDLILGRARPRLAETHALTGRRRTTLVRYYDEGGQRHSFYTGRGMSLERLIASGAIADLADEIGEDHNYQPLQSVGALEERTPKNPAQTKIYSTNRTMREALRG